MHMDTATRKHVMALGLAALRDEQREQRRERNCKRLFNVLFDALIETAWTKANGRNKEFRILTYRLKNGDTGHRIIYGGHGTKARHKNWDRVHNELEALADKAAGRPSGCSWRDDNLPFWHRSAASHTNNDFAYGVLDTSVEVLSTRDRRLWLVYMHGPLWLRKIAHPMAAKALANRMPSDLSIGFRCYSAMARQVDVDGADWAKVTAPRWLTVKRLKGEILV